MKGINDGKESKTSKNVKYTKTKYNSQKFHLHYYPKCCSSKPHIYLFCIGQLMLVEVK